MNKVFITGGSGTIGSSFIKKYYKKYSFLSYSRNEKMQVALKRQFPNIEIILGSVEDKLTLTNAMRRFQPDYVIHAAALKHVDTAEISPIQAVNSNVIGSLNIINAAFDTDVPLTIGISTDKACAPDNNYGHTKSLMERMFLESFTKKNKFLVCRFGNVSHSHGSVIPFWLRLRENREALKLTDKRMTRLMFSRDESVSLVHKLLKDGNKAERPYILSKKMKTVNLYELAQVISHDIEEIGLRPGEKLYEELISKKEIPFTEVKGDHIYIYQNNINKIKNLKKPYSSDNAQQMTREEIIDLVAEANDSLKKTLINKAIY
jgi:UDP-N-acetylglucosamine 4,6-dehydratase